MLAEAAEFTSEMTPGEITTLAQNVGCYILEVGRREFGGQYYWFDQRDQLVNTIKGTVQNRQILVEVPDDWPEGCEVVIEPVSSELLAERSKSDVPETPEEIEEWLRWYHALEPLEFTAEEEEDLAAWRQKFKEYSIAKDQSKEVLFP